MNNKKPNKAFEAIADPLRGPAQSQGGRWVQEDEEMRPPFLYKYLPDNLERIGDVLVRRKARFSNPVKFNDPFDCMQRIGFPDADSLSEADEKLLREYVTHLDQDAGGLKTTTNQKITPEIAFAKGLHKSKQFLESMPAEIYKYIQMRAARIGVFCLSELLSSVSMWAHYASCHKGLLVEFDHTKLCDDSGVIRSFPMTYSAELPTLDDYMQAVKSSAPAEFSLLFFCRKSTDWQTEKEWRFFSETPDDDFEIPPLAITRVIFGHKMPDSVRAMVSCWIRASLPHVTLAEGRPAKDRFEIEAVNIDEQQ